MERMEWLVEELNKHCYNYYVLDNPTISDADFDKLYDELLALEQQTGIVLENSPTKRVGGEALDGFVKRQHKFRMYSLDKCRTLEQVESFVEDIKKQEPNSTFTLGYKFDGLTIVITYKNGFYENATTRGNGIIGEDVTQQVRTIKSVPLKIKFKGELIVSGEGMITNANLEKYNKMSNEPLKNARNAVSGAIRNLDPKETAKRNLDFFCYNVVYAENKNFKTQAEMNKFIKDNNFLTEPYQKVCTTSEELCKEITKVDKIKTDIGFLIDGMVIKLNEIDKREEFGYTSKFPKWAMAYKFEAQEVTSILNDIVWQVGRTGKITPIAEIEPVELAGAMVKRATLNNYGDIERKQIQKPSRVFVRRSNEVIPEILGLAELLPNSHEIEKPIVCPCCGATLQEIGALLFCPNRTGCKEQVVDRLTHFASRNAMNIEGIRDQISEQLYSKLNVTQPSDLYKLTKDELLKLDNFKDKKAQNIINSLQKSKKVQLNNLIYALGVPNVGTKTAKDLAKYFGTLNNLRHANLEELASIRDIGDIVAASVVNFFANEYNSKMIDNLLDCGIQVEESEKVLGGCLEGKTFVLTGTLPTYSRDEATVLIEKNGGQVSSSVSKKTSYVLAGESAGSKLIKAQNLGVVIISEEEFLQLIEKK
ncbi:MAG: NAD-dependent DNA ligase LigA [Clostridiales bacterium]|nr:NAD-dependent DNA ligase LigA [Clostridiales bacterium]